MRAAVNTGVCVGGHFDGTTITSDYDNVSLELPPDLILGPRMSDSVPVPNQFSSENYQWQPIFVGGDEAVGFWRHEAVGVGFALKMVFEKYNR